MTLELIAEIGSTCAGSLDNALALISAAHGAGATGVKFQAFQPDRLAARRAKHPRIEPAMAAAGYPSIGGIFIESPLIDIYREIHMPREWFPPMIARAMDLGLTWHSSVFDPDDVAFLETLDCPRYKISSFEANESDIRDAIIDTGKPHIVSVNQNEGVWPPRLKDTVLHATDYAIQPKQANLARLQRWAHTDARPSWGLSDHTNSNIAAEIATALGARMIEWHLKLTNVKTPDDAFAHIPLQLLFKVNRVRLIQEALNG